MSKYNISHAEDQAASPMEDSEQFAKMHPSFIAECQDEMSHGLAKLKFEDLPWAILLLSSSAKLVLKKIFLELVVERYEAKIEFLNSQEKSYQFRDPRAFLESLPPPKKEEISLPFGVQEEDDLVLKSHIESAVEDAKIKAAQDKDNLPVMEGLKEKSVHHVFIDPVVEYMEALISSNSPAA